MRFKAVAVFAIALLFLTASLYAQGRTYVGAEKCKLCHKIEYTSWATTPHAKAYDVLKPEDRTKKECYECHVTGGKTDMPGVQCEACHGPGSEYKTMSIMKDKQKAIAAGLIIPTEKECVQCHNKKSPTFKGFNFAEMAPKVHAKKKA
jgi:RecJ-like exonuclease